MAYYCYIVECSDGSLYTGLTTDPERRTRQHNRGQGARYTRIHGPVKLVYVEEVGDRKAAIQRELQIKHMNRARKLRLVESYTGEEPDEP
jgi:putative endonuclease